MSERVNKIVFTKRDCGTMDILFDKVYRQVRLLLESGYNCFICDLDINGGKISIEYCEADPELVHEDIPQPCWLYQNELEQLSYYQLQSALNQAKEAVTMMEKELSEEDKDKLKEILTKKKKKDDFDA